MINHQMLARKQGTGSWVLNPYCVTDRFLDYIDRLRSLIVPAQADHPSYMVAEFEARLEQFGPPQHLAKQLKSVGIGSVGLFAALVRAKPNAVRFRAPAEFPGFP